MTYLELRAACAGKIGWRAFKEKRGKYSLCVTMAPGEKEPWERARDHEVAKLRYTEVDLLTALKTGFYGRGLPDPLRDDRQAMALEDLLADRGTVIFEYGHNFSFVRNDGIEVFSAPIHSREQRRRAICECVAQLKT